MAPLENTTLLIAIGPAEVPGVWRVAARVPGAGDITLDDPFVTAASAEAGVPRGLLSVRVPELAEESIAKARRKGLSVRAVWVDVQAVTAPLTTISRGYGDSLTRAVRMRTGRTTHAVISLSAEQRAQWKTDVLFQTGTSLAPAVHVRSPAVPRAAAAVEAVRRSRAV